MHLAHSYYPHKCILFVACLEDSRSRSHRRRSLTDTSNNIDLQVSPILNEVTLVEEVKIPGPTVPEYLELEREKEELEETVRHLEEKLRIQEDR